MQSVGLVATLNDPDGRMVPFVEKCFPFLRDRYAFMVVMATTFTAPTMVEALQHEKVEVLWEGGNHIGENRRGAVQAGMTYPNSEQVSHLHYCDFDRLLYWALHDPDELTQVIQTHLPQVDYLILGRTESAWATHPSVQIETEAITNTTLAYLIGRDVDATAGSCGLSKAAAQFILTQSTERSNATDAEWAVLAHYCKDLRVDFLPTDGLAFETATFYGEGIYEVLNRASAWQARLRLAHDSIKAAFRVAALLG